MSDTQDLNFNFAVAQGRTTFRAVNKFGYNPDVDDTTNGNEVWDGGIGGADWTLPTQARVHTLVSTLDTDGKTGAPSSVGARTVRVYGLQTWSSAESSELVVMDGTTGVNTSNSYVIIHRMVVETYGSSGPNTGVITATAVSDGSETARIAVGNGQTQMAIYGVPSTQVFYVTQFYGSVAGAASEQAEFRLLVNGEPDVNTTVYRTKFLRGGATEGFVHTFDPPNRFVGPCVLKVLAIPDAVNRVVSAGFDGILETL